ncbi:MAG: FAD-dependent oxidoreductase [Calothrix sp. C42_A2020_038]|nr:FAD-dependent oxidoreductase [Calothrix sp. C42_A2020_038]
MYGVEASAPSANRNYDIICFGDEVPGVLTLVCAAREYYRQTNNYPRSLLLFRGNSKLGVGGHIVRGGLAYLERSSVPLVIRQEHKLDIFGDPPAIYKELLQRADVEKVALDPNKTDWVLREMLREVRADILSNAEIKSVVKSGQKILGIELTKDETYFAKHFIDCTVNGELAQAAGVKKLTIGLPDSELAVTLVFETQGLSVERLQNVEYQYLQRFTNPQDQEAQYFINIAAGNDPNYAEQLRRDLVDKKGYLKTMAVGKDYIDIRSRALSIAYHAFRGTKLDLKTSPGIFDKGNVALLSRVRMSWNALLFGVTANEAEILARAKAQPTRKMFDEILFVTKWFQSIGASEVKPAKELYIPHAGNITDVLAPLTGAKMLGGGVAANEALGTFGYDFDVRGGIDGLGERANNKGFCNLAFLTQPLFNIGIEHALLKYVPNLAVVSPCSGFEGYACCAGRIVEFNCGVGQGVGIAAGIALVQERELNEISNREVHNILKNTGKLSLIYGKTNEVAAAQLNEFEHSMTA